MSTDELRVGERTGWVLTQSGMRIDYTNPDPSQITIVDIGHHLSNLCRFTGGTREFYSVAQHSLFVTAIVRETLAAELSAEEQESAEFYDQLLAAMLHDAAEAYVNDLSSPLKAVIGGRYGWIEHGLQKVIYERYGVDIGYLNRLVKDADNIAMVHERYQLLPPHKDWPVDPDTLTYNRPRGIELLGPRESRDLFISAFTELLLSRNAARMQS